ncbi:myo-inosose-2 dehydratase [Marinococcus halophilus]|uniref:myo-inosose-2 dehydratase n=1 Tax=Marinococcus halophilus TaxID=1371 RepID=UPI0009A61BA4|nr:myo-inosose-2 dehydratase [Marinococcus halophilus]
MLSPQEVKIGCAPINWTNDDLPELGGDISFEQCLSEMALAGFDGSEIGTKFPKEQHLLKKAIELRNLEICNGWFSSYFTSKPKEETIEAFIKHRDFLHDVGANVIGVGEVGRTVHGDESLALFKDRPYLTDQQFHELARGLEELGRLANEKGMEIAFHYHIGTGIETLEEIDKLMELTNPDLVHLLFDTGHATVAGDDPAEILQKYVHRVNHVHIKDVRQEVLQKMKAQQLSFLTGVKLGLFTVPSDGDMVDLETIFQILDKNKYQGWIVVEAEQDPHNANPLEHAIKARDYIRIKTGL